jgi:two-component system chemotaxis response regulator CheY
MTKQDMTRQGRVLVVDDEAEIRKPIRIMLNQAGYEVVEAEDGEQAVKAIKAGDNALMVDTVLCDIRMPKVNGTEAVQYFRQEFPGVPVVILTGYPDVDLAVSLMRQGVVDYLVKPIAREKLLEVMAKAVNSHQLFKDKFAT